MKNQSPKQSKFTLILVAVVIRWAMMFILIFALITLVDFVSSLLAPQSSSGSVAFRIIFAAVGSVIANLFAQIFIAPRMNRQYREFRKILVNIANDGYSDETIAKMEELFSVCSAEPKKNAPYINQYAMFLAEAYLSLHIYDKAEEMLKAVELDFMEAQASDPNSLPAQHNIVMIYVLWVQLYAALGDKEMVENQLREGEKYFSKYRSKNEVTDYFIDTAYFESLIIHLQYENALKLLDKYSEIEQLKFGISLDKARCLKKMGRVEEADALFDKAYELASNDWRRHTVLLERNK